MPSLLSHATTAILIVAATTTFVYNRLTQETIIAECPPLPPVSPSPQTKEPPPAIPVLQEHSTPPAPLPSLHPSISPSPSIPPSLHPSTKIQVAILLDVSNSMDGLIDQAKAQLWNMVSVLGKARCDGKTPQVELALYEYGRSSNSAQVGYVKQISPFTSDLDEVSRNLFRLTTNGGDEYCGQVMHTSLTDLPWDNGDAHYKVIFIAGNEDFLQGTTPFTKACTIAKQKGVIVNTIYCGDRQQGIREHWNLGAECGRGSFTNINSNARIQDIPTPYDQELIVLNDKLNATYIGYGTLAAEGKSKQEEVDRANYEAHPSVAAKRISVKGKSEVYRNDSWDLVDAHAADTAFLTKLPQSSLPENLKGKSKAELKKYISDLSAKRNNIQKQISEVTAKRENFLAADRANKAGNKEQTLETEIEKILREQAKRYRMEIHQ
ncbi:vWA domain-containing protein [Flavihumibacter sp.]|uniref:vWA domain-containing protein n=1 Tax=Flavihumibacter sp. TaxID=1913981 RepID=UPI002FC8D46E